MRSIDQTTIDSIGIPGIVLMERAALGAVEHLLEHAPEFDHVGVLCGGGNNGGDGFAMARLLADRGFDVTVVMLREPPAGDALINLKVCRALDLEIADLGELSDPNDVSDRLSEIEADIWIDAVFGTGLDRPVEGTWAAALEFLCEQRAVFGVDIPSGMDASNGQALGPAPLCFATATFGLPKLGHAVEPCRSQCGELAVIDIGIPDVVVEQVGTSATLLTADQFHLPARPSSMHKGDAGRVLVVGGETGTTGAALMAARAALVSGAGLVTIAAPEEAAAAVHASLPEAMAVDWTSELFTSLLEGADVVICGPGMGQSATARLAFDAVVASDAAVVLDAEALHWLAHAPDSVVGRSAPTLLTPHPGEAATLLGADTADLLADPFESARRLSDRYDATVVFKNAASIIASPDGRLAANSSGNPGMATGGMGDALTGIIAARLCESGDAFDALCEAVFAHGMAGDLAAERLSERAVTVGSLLEALPLVWKLWSAR